MEEKKNVGRVYGYARVSSVGQNLDRQILALKKYVAEENIVIDKQSGKDLERPGYQALKGALGLRAGDTLYVQSLDRLSRSKQDIRQELEWFKQNKVTLRLIDLPTTMVEFPEDQKWIQEMVSNILIEVLASLAEQERITIKQRQREGIAAAREKGKHLGRPRIKMPDHFPMVYEEWKAGKYTAKFAMRKLGVSSSSFYRLVKQYEAIREQ